MYAEPQTAAEIIQRGQTIRARLMGYPLDAERRVRRRPIKVFRVIEECAPGEPIETREDDALSPLMPGWKRILIQVARKYRINHGMLLSHMRDPEIVLARNEAVYRMRTELNMSYPQIGRQLSKDHTTCIHSYRRFVKSMLPPHGYPAIPCRADRPPHRGYRRHQGPVGRAADQGPVGAAFGATGLPRRTELADEQLCGVRGVHRGQEEGRA